MQIPVESNRAEWAEAVVRAVRTAVFRCLWLQFWYFDSVLGKKKVNSEINHYMILSPGQNTSLRVSLFHFEMYLVGMTLQNYSLSGGVCVTILYGTNSGKLVL